MNEEFEHEATEPSRQQKVTADDYKDVELDKSKISDVKIITESFEGPLDLLLYLIRKNKLDIFSVSLTSITEQYMEVIRLMQQLDLELAGEYLLVAGILVEHKSRALLPSSVAPPDEDDEESAGDLEKRLQEYVIFKRIAEELQDHYEERQRRFSRPPVRRQVAQDEDNDMEFIDVDLFDLYATFKHILDEIGELHPVALSDEDFTVEEKIEEIRQALLSHEDGTFNLSEHLRAMVAKLEVIVTFLAVLEIVRLRMAKVQQLKSTLDVYLTAVIPPGEWMEDND